MKWKSIVGIILHLGFWVLTFYYFTTNSFLRFYSNDIREEYISLFLIIAVIYFNYFWMIPHLFSLQKFIKYFLLLIPLLVCITTLEFFMLTDDIKKITSAIDHDGQIVALRWNYFGIFFRDALFVGFFTMFKIYRDAIQSHKFFQEKTNLEKINLINQIEMVKSKINVHFFFNTLYSIHTMALNKSEKTPEALCNLTQLMEYVVVDSENVMIALEKEIIFLEKYIELEKIRRPNVNIKFEIEGDIQPHLVPPMIFESFVNNAFKYNDFPGNGLIAIHIVCKPKEIIFTCENAVDKSFKATVKSTGKGIRNTVNRLQIHYLNLHTLEIDDNETFYKVELILKSRF